MIVFLIDITVFGLVISIKVIFVFWPKSSTISAE